MKLTAESSSVVCGSTSGRVVAGRRWWRALPDKWIANVGLSEGLGDFFAAAANRAKTAASACTSHGVRPVTIVPPHRWCSRCARLPCNVRRFPLDRRQPDHDPDVKESQTDRFEGIAERAKPLDLAGIGQRFSIGAAGWQLRLQGLDDYG